MDDAQRAFVNQPASLRAKINNLLARKGYFSAGTIRPEREARAGRQSRRTPRHGEVMQGLLCEVEGHRCRVYSRLEDAAPFWRALEPHAPQPFLRLGWAQACARALARERRFQPLVLVFFKNDRPRLLVPLQITRHGLIRRANWLGGAFNDYNMPLSAPDLDPQLGGKLVAAAFTAMRGRAPRIDAIHLIRQPQDAVWSGPAIGTLTAEAEHGTHVLTLNGNWASQFAEMRSARSRRRLREKTKALGKLGPVSFRRSRNPQERAALAAQVMSWKSAQLQARGDGDPFDGDTALFRRAILDALEDPASGLNAYGLFAAERPVAGMIAFVDRNAFSMLVTAYEPNASSKTSPGTILLLKTLELAARAGLPRYDHLFGDEDYKREWSDRRVTIVHGFEPLTMSGWIDCQAALARIAVKKFLLRRPRALAAVYGIRRWMRRAQSNAPKAPMVDTGAASSPAVKTADAK